MEATKLKHPVLNERYEILKNLGEGNTSKVYLARDNKLNGKLVAIKVLKDAFLRKDDGSM